MLRIGTLAFAVLFSLAGCGGATTSDESPTTQGARPENTQGARQNIEPPTRAARPRGGGQEVRGRRWRELVKAIRARKDTRHSRITRLPNGGVVISPPEPRHYSVAASDSCITKHVEQDGEMVAVEVPPPPGLHAERHGRIVTLTYDTGDPPDRCRPQYITVAADAYGDTSAPITRNMELDSLGEGVVKITVPSYYPNVPTVARAAMQAEDGRALSPHAEVRISP